MSQGTMDKELESSLRRAGQLDYFKKLAPSHQAEFLKWINEAKKDQTKQKRIVKTITMLQAKQ